MGNVWGKFRSLAVWQQVAAGIVVLVVIIAAAGGGDEASEDETAAEVTTTEAEATTTTTAEVTSTTEAGTTTTSAGDDAVVCEPLVDDTAARINASLEGVNLGDAQTAAFTVEGDQGRVIVGQLDGPGMNGQVAVFMVGASGTIYAADSFAHEFSTLEEVDLDGVWDDPIDSVRDCLSGT